MGDCIDRQAVLDGIEELKKSPWATDKRGSGFEYLIKEALEVVADLCVKQLPPVTPKQKMGHLEWVQDKYYSKIGDWCCSECKSVVVESVTKEEKDCIALYKYCPQCGIKMEESEVQADD